MKIEICEQMVQSWLQHIKKCQVVQTNWMISPLRMPKDHSALPYVEWFMKDIAQKLNDIIDAETKAAFLLNCAHEMTENQEPSERAEVSSTALAEEMMSCFMALNQKERAAMANIFGKSKPHQFITQCEIDVMGVKLYDAESASDQIGVEKIYLIDSAFHKGTLGYGDVVARVLKKIIRACVVSELVFGTGYAVEVAFATPDCAPGYTQKIADLVDVFRDLLKKHYSPKYDNIEIKLYFNDVFAEEIYYPLREKIDELNNDNDLFMRSLNLANVTEEKLPNPKKATTSTGRKSKSPTLTPVSLGSAGARSGTASSSFSDDQQYAAAAYYLRHEDATLGKVQVNALGIPENQGNGSPAKNVLNHLGIDTGRSSSHKGMLLTIAIDDAIANSTDTTFKRTLEEIKIRGL